MHSFRVRLRTSPEAELHVDGNDWPTTIDGFMYGFSHFTQRRDTSSKRGYQQVRLKDFLSEGCTDSFSTTRDLSLS